MFVTTAPGTVIVGPTPPIDPILSSGSLLLLEPANPRMPWAPGIPLNGAEVPNIAYAQSAPLVGGDATLTYENLNSSARFLVERSSRGGFHVIPSPTLATSGQNVLIALGTKLRDYIGNNLNHAYYLSWWGEITKPALTGGGNGYQVLISATGTEFAVYTSADTGVSAGAPTAGSGRRLGALFRADTASRLHVVAGTGSAPTGAITNSFMRYGATTPAQVGKLPSLLTWRVYLEDLTVSGRSYSEVSTLDTLLYTSNVLSAGGRYYGDTYTDPTILP